MKNEHLQQLWKDIDSEMESKSREELDKLLDRKARKTVNKFISIIAVDILAAFGLIVFLLITALNRSGDTLYLVNNSILGVTTMISLVFSLLSWNKLRNRKADMSLKTWLDGRIRMINKWLFGKYSRLYVVVIPILLVMILMSIHVYYEYKPFTEVMRNEESIAGLIVGFLIGLFVAFFSVGKIRRYQKSQLEYLRKVRSALDE